MHALKKKQLLIGMLVASIILSTPSILRVPRMLPFLNAEVRAAAPKAIEELRSQGIWINNTELMKIEETEDGICFEWEHRYRRPVGMEEAEPLTTCIPHA